MSDNTENLLSITFNKQDFINCFNNFIMQIKAIYPDDNIIILDK